MRMTRERRAISVEQQRTPVGGDQLKQLVRFAIGCVVWAFLIPPAAAQGLGVRAGASVDPDQFYFGGHAETAPLVDQLHFRPNLEIGLGNGVTVVAVNVEFTYEFLPSETWNLYAGGGPALHIIDTEDATHSEGGFNLLFGIAHEGWFVSSPVKQTTPQETVPPMKASGERSAAAPARGCRGAARRCRSGARRR